MDSDVQFLGSSVTVGPVVCKKCKAAWVFMQETSKKTDGLACPSCKTFGGRFIAIETHKEFIKELNDTSSFQFRPAVEVKRQDA